MLNIEKIFDCYLWKKYLLTGRGHYVVLLGKALYSHSASLRPGIEMGTSKPKAWGNPAMD